MKYVYIVTGVIFLLCLLFYVIARCRTRYAVWKVSRRSDEEKIRDLNKTIMPYGYCYERIQDMFITTMYPWQRETGYCRLYDESAVSMSMVIDCEPIEFEYNGELYLIEFWKGQYGMTCGAEVGVYKADKPNGYKKGDFIFYQSVDDKEMLPISMVVYKNGKTILTRRARHWWLTAFELGMYSTVSELTMSIRITFPDYRMCSAFVRGLLEAGYRSDEIEVYGQVVVLFFGAPKTKQPLRKWKILRRMAEKQNRRFCKRYLKLTRRFERTLDRVDFLRCRYKILFFIAMHFGRALGRGKNVYRKKAKAYL